MTFMETAYGKEICDLSVRALRKYTQKTEQYAITAHITSISDDINAELAKGARFIDMKLTHECNFIVIFEKVKQ